MKHNTENIDISKIKFSSTLFPSPEDLALWNSLTDEQRVAILLRDETIANQSGIAPKETKDEILNRVRSENQNIL